MGEAYLWIKAVHVMAVISWMAGLFYLPRLFVYHADARPGSELSETLKIMERRLLRAIMHPAAVVSWGLGLLMAISGGVWSEGWFQLKAVLVVLLTLTHFYLAHCQQVFARDGNTRSNKFYRMLNEVPTLLLIGIVLMVVPKPF
jgi:putative membrane protein